MTSFHWTTRHFSVLLVSELLSILSGQGCFLFLITPRIFESTKGVLSIVKSYDRCTGKIAEALSTRQQTEALRVSSTSPCPSVKVRSCEHIQERLFSKINTSAGAYNVKGRDGEDPAERLGDRKALRTDTAPNCTERKRSRTPCNGDFHLRQCTQGVCESRL